MGTVDHCDLVSCAKETASAFALEMHLRVHWAMSCSVVVAPNFVAAGATLVGGAGTGDNVAYTL